MRTLIALVFTSSLAFAQNESVVAKKTSGGVEVTVDGKPFTTLVVRKEDLAKPYLYPILAPCGTPVTRDWPMKTGTKNETKDHVHQKSAWLCHGDIIPEGVELKIKSSDKHVKGVDFWSESPGHGTIAMKSMVVTDGNCVTLHLDWKAPEGLVILTEQRVYNFTVVSGGRLISMMSVLIAENYPVTFGDTKEGSFGIRVHDSLRMQLKGGDGMLTNAAGKQGEKDIWGLPAEWCDYSGTVDGKKVGVAIFTHPDNPSPSLWHSRAYGLHSANPFGRTASGFPGAKDRTDLFKIEKGKSAMFRFAIFAHDGDDKDGKVAEAFEKYKQKGL